jgi:hypothetical protein
MKYIPKEIKLQIISERIIERHRRKNQEEN